MTNRLKKELAQLTTNNPLHGVTITSDPNNRLIWQAIVAGPEGTVYQGGKFQFLIEIPDNYPFEAPDFTLTTKIFHPNFDEVGRLCNILIETKYQWQPTKTVKQVLEKILNIMGNVVPEHTHNFQAMQLYLDERNKFEDVAREIEYGKKISFLIFFLL